jgi:hypothetical protein
VVRTAGARRSGQGMRNPIEPEPYGPADPPEWMPVDEFIFFAVFGGAIVTAVGFGLAWARTRQRLDRLESRFLQSAVALDFEEVEERLNQMTARMEQMARGQEFLHQLVTGRRRLPESGRRVGATPS